MVYRIRGSPPKRSESTMERTTATPEVEGTRTSRAGRSELWLAIVLSLAPACELLAPEKEPQIFSYRVQIPRHDYAGPIPPVLVDGDTTTEFILVDAEFHRWALSFSMDTPLSERVTEVRVEYPSPCGITTLLPGPEPDRTKEELRRSEQGSYRLIDYEVYSAWRNDDTGRLLRSSSFVTVDARDLEEVEVTVGQYVLPKVKNRAVVLQMPTPNCAETIEVKVNGEVVGTIDGGRTSYGDDIVIDAKGSRCYELDFKSYSTSYAPRPSYLGRSGPRIIRDQRVVISSDRPPNHDHEPFPVCPISIDVPSYQSTATCNQIQPVACPRRITLTTDPAVTPSMAHLANGASAAALTELLGRRSYGLDPTPDQLPASVSDVSSKTRGRVELSLCVDRRGRPTVSIMQGFNAEVDALFSDTLKRWTFRPLASKAKPATRCTVVEYDVDFGSA